MNATQTTSRSPKAPTPQVHDPSHHTRYNNASHHPHLYEVKSSDFLVPINVTAKPSDYLTPTVADKKLDHVLAGKKAKTKRSTAPTTSPTTPQLKPTPSPSIEQTQVIQSPHSPVMVKHTTSIPTISSRRHVVNNSDPPPLGSHPLSEAPSKINFEQPSVIIPTSKLGCDVASVTLIKKTTTTTSVVNTKSTMTTGTQRTLSLNRPMEATSTTTATKTAMSPGGGQASRKASADEIDEGMNSSFKDLQTLPEVAPDDHDPQMSARLEARKARSAVTQDINEEDHSGSDRKSWKVVKVQESLGPIIARKIEKIMATYEEDVTQKQKEVKVELRKLVLHGGAPRPLRSHDYGVPYRFMFAHNHTKFLPHAYSEVNQRNKVCWKICGNVAHMKDPYLGYDDTLPLPQKIWPCCIPVPATAFPIRKSEWRNWKPFLFIYNGLPFVYPLSDGPFQKVYAKYVYEQFEKERKENDEKSHMATLPSLIQPPKPGANVLATLPKKERDTEAQKSTYSALPQSNVPVAALVDKASPKKRSGIRGYLRTVLRPKVASSSMVKANRIKMNMKDGKMSKE